MSTHSNLRAFVLVVLVCGSLMTGIMFDYMPAMVDVGIKRHIELATNEEIISFWSKPPFDVQSYYWLFNISNPEDFMAGEKAKVGRVGPFHLTSRMSKNIIKLSENKLVVTFNSTRVYSLDESELPASFDTPVVALNAIYGALTENVRERVRWAPGQATTIVASVTKLAERFNETLLMRLTPRQLLLGRESTFVKKAKKMAEAFGQELSSAAMSMDNIGYLSATNGTQVGPYQIYTGYQESAKELGDLISFAGRQRGALFSGKCNRIQASIGELRPMPIEHNKPLEMYNPMFDRIIHLKPTGQRRVREGIAINYMFDELDFESAERNPELGCFCSKATLDSYCSLRGAMELAPVIENVPLVFTVSHMEPDERIKSSIANWDHQLVSSHLDQLPDPENKTHMLILKRFGIPYHLDFTAVLYMKVTKDPTFKQTASVPEVSYIPLFMQRELVQVPEQFLKPVVDLEAFLNLTKHLKLVMYITTLILLGWLSSMLYRRSVAATDRVTPSNGTSSTGLADDVEGVAIVGVTPLGSGVTAVAIGLPISGVDSFSRPNGQPMSIQQRRASLQVPLKVSNLGLANQISNQQQQQQPTQKAIMFSKIDEDIMARQAKLAQHKSGSIAVAPAPLGALDEQPTGAYKPMDGSAPDVEALKGRNSSVKPSLANTSRMNSSASSIAGSLSAAEAAREGPANLLSTGSGRRNWFVRVYADVVRVFTDIKLSISNASKLDIKENDSRDRQLELLAGRIDNWYVNQAGESTTPSQEGAIDEAAVPKDASKDEQEQQPEHSEQPVAGPSGSKTGAQATTPDPPGSQLVEQIPVPAAPTPTSPKPDMQDVSSQTTIDKTTSADDSAGQTPKEATETPKSGDELVGSPNQPPEAAEVPSDTPTPTPDPKQGEHLDTEPEEDHEGDNLIDESDNAGELDSDKDVDSADKAKALQQLEQSITGTSAEATDEAPEAEKEPPKAQAATQRHSVRRQAGAIAPESEPEAQQDKEPATKQADKASAGKGLANITGDAASGVENKMSNEAKDRRRDSGVKLESRNEINTPQTTNSS